MKKIPYVEMTDGYKVETCPPDGLYAVISYGEHLARGSRVGLPVVFPWMARLYRFKDGEAEDIACGSHIGNVLTDHDVAKVFLVGIKAEQRAELEQILAAQDISLVYCKDANLKP